MGGAVLASSGAKRNQPALPQHSTLARITAAAFPLVAQSRKPARAHCFDFYRAPNPATDQPTIIPRHPQTSFSTSHSHIHHHHSQQNLQDFQLVRFLHQNISLSICVRQAAEFRCPEKSRPKGRGTGLPSPGELAYLKPI